VAKISLCRGRAAI